MGFWVKVVCFFSGYWTIGIVINDKLYQKLPEFSSSPDMLLSIEITLFTSWTDANTGNEQDIFNSTFFSASLYFLCPRRPFFFLFISADRGSLLLGPSLHRRQKILVIQSLSLKKRLDRATIVPWSQRRHLVGTTKIKLMRNIKNVLSSIFSGITRRSLVESKWFSSQC